MSPALFAPEPVQQIVARASLHGVRHAQPVTDIRDTKNMKYFRCTAMPALASVILAFQPAYAAPEDYEFQLVENELKQGDATVAVKLVDKRTNVAVENAVVFATRMDMEPDGMATMTSPVEVLPSDAPGVYRFKTDLTMTGAWRFSIAAKVQGETGTVQGRLVFRAVE
jgi:hypothetical protein